MAKEQNQLQAGKFTELRNRILFLLGALLVFRIGAHITLPGVNPEIISTAIANGGGNSQGLLNLFNTFTGGAFEQFSIFALGVMPYISASIIVQLLGATIPSLKELKKEGEAGRNKLTMYTRYGTLLIAVAQAIPLYFGLPALVGAPEAVDTSMAGAVPAIFTLVAGTMFLVWLGEQITERGIGNGISMLIFAGIVASLPGSILALFAEDAYMGLGLLVLFFLVIVFAVFMERAQRRIRIEYARRQQGRRVYGGQSSHLPLKINMAGVIPPIFASSIILFPSSIISFIGGDDGGIASTLTSMLVPGGGLYIFIYSALIIFFCFFYTALQFDSRDTADNLKRSNAFIPGIRPGEQTARYIDLVLTRLTVIGAAYITVICLIPEIIMNRTGVYVAFGGTALLIMVVVVMDFMAQLQSHLMSQQYGGLMEKANLKSQGGAGRPR